jgi:hypothetical protein
MLEFKRFITLIYIHLTLSVCLLILSTIFVVKFEFLTQSWQQAFFGLLWTIVIFGFIGLFWGTIATEKKKLLLPLILYMIVLVCLFGLGFTSLGWFIFINGNLPYTYFIRNVPQRDVFVLLAYGASCILPSLSLYLAFRLNYTIAHRKT